MDYASNLSLPFLSLFLRIFLCSSKHNNSNSDFTKQKGRLYKSAILYGLTSGIERYFKFLGFIFNSNLNEYNDRNRQNSIYAINLLINEENWIILELLRTDCVMLLKLAMSFAIIFFDALISPPRNNRIN